MSRNGRSLFLYLLPAEEGRRPCLLGSHGALSLTALGRGPGYPPEVPPLSLDKEKRKYELVT